MLVSMERKGVSFELEALWRLGSEHAITEEDTNSSITCVEEDYGKHVL